MPDRPARGGAGVRGGDATAESAREAGAPPGAVTASGRGVWTLPRWTLPPWGGLALLLLAALWIYLPAIRTPFFADDYLFLEQARHRSLIEALTSADPLGNFFRPVGRQLYFWLVAHASGESPQAFHAVNLGLFLLLLVLLFAVTRRVAGGRAAVLATAVLALSYTADVPVRWAAGSQELLGVAGALAAILLHLSGRRALAAVALLAGALSKETVLITPLVAAVADRRTDEPLWRAGLRAWPLGAAVGVWALLWALAPGRHAGPGAGVALDPVGPVAAIAHLVQVVLGAEWRKGAYGHPPRVMPPLVPLALAFAAIWLAGGWNGGRGREGGTKPGAQVSGGTRSSTGGMKSAKAAARREAGAAKAGGGRPGRDAPHAGRTRHPPLEALAAEPGRALWVGAAWAVLGAAPVAAVASIWSAYYYLFALCGAALAIGAWLATRPMWMALAVVAGLATGSASARALEEFAVARTPWTGQSHINRSYIERASKTVERYLVSLRRARPALPPGSTLFFGGLKGNVAFQTTDGPLIRWAYRDSSLRSYYLNDFSLDRARRGPMFFFFAAGDTLSEMERGPDLHFRIAFSMIVNDRPAGARDALLLELERDPSSARAHYWSAWAQWARGDTAGTAESLRRAGVTPEAGASQQVREALAAVQAGDTLGAFRIVRGALAARGLDAGAHALLADLLLVKDPEDIEGTVEAYAARVLVPEQPYGWRRWGMVQARRGRYVEALASFERYFALMGGGGEQDQEARRWVETIRGMLPGGDLAAEGRRE